MEKYLTEANWKATGQKHVPPLAKTGVTDALKVYAKADKVALSVAGSAGRKKALNAIEEVVKKALGKFAKHPKLVAELKKVEKAVQSERDAYNAKLGAMTVAYARDDSHLGKMLRAQSGTEFTMENIEFIEGAAGKLKPNELYDRFIAPGSKQEINVAAGLVKQLKEKRDADKLTLADFSGVVEKVEANMVDTLDRLKAQLYL